MKTVDGENQETVFYQDFLPLRLIMSHPVVEKFCKIFASIANIWWVKVKYLEQSQIKWNLNNFTDFLMSETSLIRI